MDHKEYFARKLEDVKSEQDLYEGFLQREAERLSELKKERVILEAILAEAENAENAGQRTAESGKASEPRQEAPALDMSPREFSAFIKNWVMAHLEDERLSPGHVERMFNTAVEMYKRKRVSLDSVRAKMGLTDWEKFRRKNGLYSADIYNQYWVDRFKETYGYTPELP